MEEDEYKRADFMMSYFVLLNLSAPVSSLARKAVDENPQ